jgi:predicted Zn-dependent protease
MKKMLFIFVFPVFIMAVCTQMLSCRKNANGRNTLSLVDDATVRSLSDQQYASFLSTNPPVTGTSDAERVARVGGRVIAGVQSYLTAKGLSDLVKDYQWEFNLVSNPEVNAWCMPGGKIVIYSGILPVTQTDSGLAVVMGHEIAHAVLKHGSEQMSQQLVIQYGGVALSTLLSSKPAETQALFNSVYGISSTLGTLAHSRKQESEADEMGLYFMASAGYDPNTAVSFWERMQAQGTSSTPVFLSTHPSDADRIKNIKALIPGAMQYYHP